MLPFLVSPYRHALNRERMIQVIGGDDIAVSALLLFHGDPARPEATLARACLAETNYSKTPLWEGSWFHGIEPLNTGLDGLVRIDIPHDVTDTLREGIYTLSVSVSDILGKSTQTVAEGTVQLRYAGTSPIHDIPYRDSTEA